MSKFKAKILGEETYNLNPAHRKENGFHKAFMVLGAGQRKAAIDARVYWSSTAATCYVCVWIHHDDTKKGVSYYRSGSGKAGGGGYHKPSAALGDALAKAGVWISQPIHGRGDASMRDALLATGRAIGLRNPFIIEAHP